MPTRRATDADSADSGTRAKRTRRTDPIAGEAESDARHARPAFSGTRGIPRGGRGRVNSRCPPSPPPPIPVESADGPRDCRGTGGGGGGGGAGRPCKLALDLELPSPFLTRRQLGRHNVAKDAAARQACLPPPPPPLPPPPAAAASAARRARVRSGRNAAACRYQEIAAAPGEGTARAIVIALLNASPPPSPPRYHAAGITRAREARAVAYDDHTRGCCDATTIASTMSFKLQVSRVGTGCPKLIVARIGREKREQRARATNRSRD